MSFDKWEGLIEEKIFKLLSQEGHKFPEIKLGL